MATNPFEKYVRGFDYELYSLKNGTYYIVYYPGKVDGVSVEDGNFVHDGREVRTELDKGEFESLFIKTVPYTTKYYDLTVQLPPVDVVATKPTSAAAGNNAKILLLVVGVAAALILFNK